MSADVSDSIRKLTQKVRDNTARVVRDGPLDGDSEAIHDYRVALRRLRTMLRPLRRAYGAHKVKAIEAALKRFADRTGPLREEEVLAETLQDLTLGPAVRGALQRWLDGRARRLAGTRRAVARELSDRRPTDGATADAPPLTGGYLEVVLADLESLLDKGPKKHRSAADTARAALGRAAAEVRAFSAELDPADVDGMHLLRIRFKRLRYTAELLGPSLDLPPAVQKSAAHMQKVLGHLHDLDDAIGTVTRTRSLAVAPRQAARVALDQARAAAARKAARDLASKLAVIDHAFASLQPEVGKPIQSDEL